MSGYDNRGTTTLQVGYMPLIDCAPLVAAVRLGLDVKHGLRLQLQRQASWAAIRDKLLSGELDAVHALAGLVYGVETGIGGPQADLAILMTLNQNGQAITLSPVLAQQLQQGTPLREALAALPRRAVFAQTFPTGTHAMWLYYWLAAHGVDPMIDIQGVTLPPPQMPAALARGELDGYCAGEPWAAEAEALGAGQRVIRSGQIWPGHPEKVFACRREFAALQPETTVALTAVVLEACRWLDEPENRRQAVQWLADPDVIDLPAERIAACLLPSVNEDPAQRLRFHDDGQVNFPWLSDGRWFLQQFRRWGLLPGETPGADDVLLGNVHRLETYRKAAALVDVRPPTADSRENLLFDDDGLSSGN
jgi:two-component system, oxyanion-binding sensor